MKTWENVQSITHSPAYGPDGDPQGDVMLNIFYGRENLDKEKFIFESVGDRALIMVPDQYTLEAERQAFRHLGVSSLMDVEMYRPPVSAAIYSANWEETSEAL